MAPHGEEGDFDMKVEFYFYHKQLRQKLCWWKIASNKKKKETVEDNFELQRTQN